MTIDVEIDVIFKIILSRIVQRTIKNILTMYMSDISKAAFNQVLNGCVRNLLNEKYMSDNPLLSDVMATIAYIISNKTIQDDTSKYQMVWCNNITMSLIFQFKLI